MGFMPSVRVVPLFVYRTSPVVVCVRGRGTSASGGQWGRLGTHGVDGLMGTAVAAPVRLSVRRDDVAVVDDLEWSSVPLGLLREARPWRTFRWFKGQQHYSGTYWSATMGDHVIYESRLELGRLLFADYRRDWLFDPDLVAALRTADLDGMPLGDAFRLLPECPQPLVKSAVLHLLWSGHVTTALDRPLSAAHVLRRAA